MSSGKRAPLPIEMKVEVLEALKYKSKIDVAREFGIGYSTVKKINKNEAEILAKAGFPASRCPESQTPILPRKRNRPSPNEEIGLALITWYRQMKMQDVPITGPMMIGKSKEIAGTLGYVDFKPTKGWLDGLKMRYNIRFDRTRNHHTIINNVDAGNWVENVLPRMIEGYDPENVFNAVETALFYKAAPSILTGNQTQNGTMDKDVLTVLFFCNATGTDKHAFVIGKNPNPSCFDTEGTPLPYYNNANALMTEFIWWDILKKLDQNLGERKIILLVDNTGFHKVKLKLRNIKIALFPADSSLIQPLDRGIIRMVKIRYRSQLLKKLISVSNAGVLASEFAETMDLFQALSMLERAWTSITPAMIVDCFQKAGFYADDIYCLEELPDVSPEAVELKELLQDEFDSFIECDKNVNCFENSAVFESPSAGSSKQGTVADRELEVIDNTVPRVSHEEALNALSIVRKYLDENFSEYNAYYEVEEMIRLSAYANSGTRDDMVDSF